LKQTTAFNTKDKEEEHGERGDKKAKKGLESKE